MDFNKIASKIADDFYFNEPEFKSKVEKFTGFIKYEYDKKFTLMKGYLFINDERKDIDFVSVNNETDLRVDSNPINPKMAGYEEIDDYINGLFGMKEIRDLNEDDSFEAKFSNGELEDIIISKFTRQKHQGW